MGTRVAARSVIAKSDKRDWARFCMRKERRQREGMIYPCDYGE